MILKLRQRMAQEESGFTLVELLVVMLILGILAAIAIPAFLNQREKANDADAKADVNTAQQAMETYQTDNAGSYVGADVAALEGIEPALQNATLAVTGSGGAGAPTANAYRVTVTADSTAHTFAVNNNAGVLTYPCTPAAGGGGCSGGTWHP
jgi:type IV pilus assembly protein PilA